MRVLSRPGIFPGQISLLSKEGLLRAIAGGAVTVTRVLELRTHAIKQM